MKIKYPVIAIGIATILSFLDFVVNVDGIVTYVAMAGVVLVLLYAIEKINFLEKEISVKLGVLLFCTVPVFSYLIYAIS